MLISATFASIAILSSALAERAVADIIVVDEHGLSTVKEPRLRAELAKRRALERQLRVTVAPVDTFGIVPFDTVGVVPLGLSPLDRGAVLRARSLAHARALVWRDGW